MSNDSPVDPPNDERNSSREYTRGSAAPNGPTPGEQPAGRWQRIRIYLSEPQNRKHLRKLGGRFALATLGAFVLYLLILIPTTPSTADLVEARDIQGSQLLSADGKPLGVFSRQQKSSVKLSQVSPHVIDALIATEDRRFYQHHGIDFKRTVAAIFNTLGGDSQGGSTITQQLVRNLFPQEIGRTRTLHRKFREMVTAIKIERVYSKQQILETYLNTVPFLYNVYGIEMAARTYFDKPALKLDALESATLVGMLKGTSYYNPIVNPERSQKRRNVVLAQMLKSEKLSDADYKRMIDKPLNVHFTRASEQFGKASHFAAHVRKALLEWAEQNDQDLYSDGLIIHTTIDMSLQLAAAKAVERQADGLQNIADVEWSRSAVPGTASAPAYAQMRKKIEPFRYFWESRGDLVDAFIRESPEYKKALAGGASDQQTIDALRGNPEYLAALRAAKTRLEAGFVAMDPATGEIKAWVGSRDFERDQFDHVVQAQRQPGSTFKAIVYGAALEQGLSPTRMYYDAPVEIRMGGGAVWRPTDMHEATGGPMSLRDGLVYSKNTITAQVMQDVGIDNVVTMARSLGVDTSPLDPVPSLALGTSPVTLLEMVSAYSTIAQQGEYRKPIFIKRITDRHGNVLADFTSSMRRGMSATSAIELVDIMRGVVNEGTGQSIKTRFGLVADLAGKTGTTQNNTDGWFILMHPNLVAGSWVGFNDARVTMRSSYWGQGAHNALLIVGDFFRDAMKARRIDVKAQFERPAPRPPALIDIRGVPPGAPPPEENSNQSMPGAMETQSTPSGNSIVTVRIGDKVLMTDAAGMQGIATQSPQSSAPARGADELNRIMLGMGRDAATGARVENP
ncbi:transglycosylase domain-containing protein [soil metagenome]